MLNVSEQSVTVVSDIFHTITMENALRCVILFDVPLVFWSSSWALQPKPRRKLKLSFASLNCLLLNLFWIIECFNKYFPTVKIPSKFRSDLVRVLNDDIMQILRGSVVQLYKLTAKHWSDPLLRLRRSFSQLVAYVSENVVVVCDTNWFSN